jgi:hypothetical protein
VKTFPKMDKILMIEEEERVEVDNFREMLPL